MPQATIQSEKATIRQQVAIRQRAKTYGIDENAACMSYAKCLPDMLSKRAANQFIEYLETEDCRNRYGIKRQSRCPECRMPLPCECGEVA